jgi:3'-phosphoadenosine 5'-phosphosulfate (PAPS) 3'-phosphatase
MVQEELGLDTKKDRSLVTTADYAAQALISWRVGGAGVLRGHPCAC